MKMNYAWLCLCALLCAHAAAPTLAAALPDHIVGHDTPTAISHQSFTRVLKKPATPIAVMAPLTSYAPPPSGPEDGLVGDFFREAEAAGSHPPAAGKVGFDQDDRVEVAFHRSAADPLQFELAAAAAAGSADVGPTPVVQTQRHTPAHLTYAASPVVYHMLPAVKPVRSISFDELRPSPRLVETLH